MPHLRPDRSQNARPASAPVVTSDIVAASVVTRARFRLLGPMEIRVDDAPVKLPGAAERALLVHLLLSPGRTVPATLLVDRLWSESTLPVDPMNALQLRVSKLRRALAAVGVTDLVGREGVGYQAAVEPEQVDALDFERRLRLARAQAESAARGGGYGEAHLVPYDEALSLWRGQALVDFAGESWAVAEARRLEELRLGALTERAQIALALGRHVEVIGDLDPWVSQDAKLESLAGLLMLALYRAGRQADALEVYQRTRLQLDEELGLEPSVSLRSLHERILRQDAELGDPPTLAPTVPTRARGDESHAAPTNLPTVERHLIGRDEELDAVTELLGGVRLLTLIGPGGAGKTSLALSAAVRVAERYPDGVFGVRLASVATGEHVALAIADALGTPLDGAAAVGDVHERLLAYLSRREVLILLDNCEHLVDPVAQVVESILGRCAGVTVMATSREALAIPDEVQLAVGPLEVPARGTRAGSVLDYPAAQLFAERARALRPGLVFDAEALDAIGRITRALDGLPLAIELAAARVAAMSPGEIASRLDDRFALLTSGSRTAEARQRTLRAAVDWSYELLDEVERRVFDRLSVFHGGWTLSAAEAVIADETLSPSRVLDAVGRLVERSMIVVEPARTTRYWMLETLRQYAAERLALAPGAEGVRRRHAGYFRDLARESEVALRGNGQRDALRSLRNEQPNIKAALDWFTGEGQDVDSALELAGSLGLFWHLGRHLEGRAVLNALLRLPGGGPQARARALQALSLVERPRGCLVHPSSRCAQAARESLEAFEQAGGTWHAALSKVLLAVEGVTGAERAGQERLLAEAECDFRAAEDAWGEAVIGFVRMETALKAGDADTAIELGRATSNSFRRLDDAWGLSATLYHLGWGLREFGRYDEGARALEQAIDVATSAGLWNTVQWALADLGVARVHIGDPEAAGELFERAASASREVGDGAGEILAEYGFGLLARIREEWDVARRRYAKALAGFQDLGTPAMEGSALVGLARCQEAVGEVAAAKKSYQRALVLGRETSDGAVTASALEGLGRLTSGEGEPGRAADLFEEARSVRSRSHRPAPPHEASHARVPPQDRGGRPAGA